MNKDMSYRVAVVGAGVIGLSTAVNIIENIPGVKVTLIADKFSPNTTGDVAAGFWKPYSLGETPKKKLLKWGRSTWTHLLHIMQSPAAKQAGVQMLSGYMMFTGTTPDKEYSFIYPRCEDMTPSEMGLFGQDNLSGAFFTSLQCECWLYLPWLLKRFKENGGSLLKKHLENLKEIYEDYDVIVNCTGIGASRLVNDSEVYPIKGHIVKVIAPWIKHFYISEDGAYYIVPGQEFVYLGGTIYKDDWSLQPKPKDRERILEGCCQILPSLKAAKVIGEVTGLRPGRSTVRLDTEQISYQGKSVQIVHNYGHGGGGITLHWGCAEEATQLVKRLLTKSKL